jgi:hypothetical protein
VTVGYGPLLRRDGPPPQGRNNTLLQVVASMGLLITEDDDHWQNGIVLQSYPSDQANGFDPCGSGSTHLKVEGGAIKLPQFGPVEIYFSETCTARVVGPEETWFLNRARLGLGGAEEAAVENVLATGGAVPANPHLTDSNLNQLHGGTSTNPVEGLALLEEQIGGTRKGGIIHAAPATITYWTRFRLIKEPTKEGQLYTQSGTPVVCGYGYIGDYPDGGTPVTTTQDWAFATGPVKIWREPAITIYPGAYAEALNRSTNDLTYRAERTYVITWDTVLQAGVLIDRSIDP